MQTNGFCAIWGTPARREEYREGDSTSINSPRAGGEYSISGTAEAIFEKNPDIEDRYKALLTTWLVDQRRLGNTIPTINSDILKEVESCRDLKAIDRADRILKYLEKKTSHIGERIAYKVFRNIYQDVNIDAAETIYLEFLAHSECISYEELHFLMDYLNGNYSGKSQ